MAGIDDAEARLAAILRAYMHIGLENPALYRLMFGPALSSAGTAARPAVARAAGADARAVLEDVIRCGARSGAFAVSPDDPKALALAALSPWSAAHGLTMFMIDRIPRPDLSVDELIGALLRMVVAGLRQPRTEQPRPAATHATGAERITRWSRRHLSSRSSC